MHLPAAITNILPFAQTASDLGKSANCSVDPLQYQCSSPEAQHLASVCRPQTENATLQLSFPCIQNDIIRTQCYFGRTFDEVWNTTSGSFTINRTWTPQGPLNQRLCACESHFFDTLTGCGDCYEAHGGGAGYFYRSDAVSSMSSSYCAATSTPTAGLNGMLSSWDSDRAEATSILSSAIAQAKTSTYTDPLATQTAVSLYYTPSVTGKAIFNIAGVTQGAKPTATNVVNGQITNANSASGGTMRIKVALAAVMGLAAVVALL